MASFTKGGDLLSPFGINEFLRSTIGVKRESYTVYAPSVPDETVDGHVTKVLQRGEVMATIISGPGDGMIGPFQNDVLVTDGRSDPDNIVGINDTFLPWQLTERDVAVAVVYEATVVQEWCFQRDTIANDGVRVPLTEATAVTALQKNATNTRMDIKLV